MGVRKVIPMGAKHQSLAIILPFELYKRKIIDKNTRFIILLGKDNTIILQPVVGGSAKIRQQAKNRRRPK